MNLNKIKSNSFLTFDDVNIIPKYSEIESRSDVDITSKLTDTCFIKTPLVSAPMDTVTETDMAYKMAEHGAVGAIHRFHDIEYHAELITNLLRTQYDNGMEDYPVIASIGVTGDWKERASELFKCGSTMFLLDVAHGHHILVKNALEYLKSEFDISIIAGSVSTAKGAKDLQEWGADAIRFGQGNGSLCETRIRTGIGIPQLSGLMWARSEVSIPIIADGGIRTIGDVAKALAAGANTVMLGSLLSGTLESPGPISRVGNWPNESLYKKFRGSASLDAKLDRGESKNVEGNSKIIPYKGSIDRIISDITDGLKSACSYVGAKNIKEFYENAEFVKVTAAGMLEAKPHLLH